MKLNSRDKRMLIILALFFAGVALFLYVFEPLNKQHKKLSRKLDAEKNQLKTRQRIIREYRSWKRDKESLSVKTAAVLNPLKINPAGLTAAQIVDILAASADKSGVSLTSVRPLKGTMDAEGGIMPDSVTVEGVGSFGSVMQFSSEVYGLAVRDFSLSVTEGNNLRFYFRLSAAEIENLPELEKLASTVDLPKPDTAQQMPALFDTPVETEPENVQVSADEPQPEEMQEYQGALSLVGITMLGADGYAIISGAGDADAIVTDGANVGGKTVKKVSADAVLFEDGSTLKLPVSAAANIQVADSEDAEPENITSETTKDEMNETRSDRGGRLGLVLTETGGGDITAGLMVQSVMNDTAQLQQGDIIISINGINISTLSEAKDVMRNVYAGETASLTVIRHGEQLYAELTTF